MRRVNLWMPAVLVVGAAAGYAVVGRGSPIAGDMVLSLDTTTPPSAVPAGTEAPPSPESSTAPAPLAADQAAARIVLAAVVGWDQAALEALSASLTAEGFTNVVIDAAAVDADTSRLRVGAGFDAAAAVVARVLGLAGDVAEPLAGATDTWGTLDAQADVLVLLGTDLRD